MAVDVALESPGRARRVAISLSARTGLVALVAVSFVVRAVEATMHATPVYFPDEYIYAAISRSIGSQGQLLVRGGPAHFPAILEPLAEAPFWALASTQTAYRLIQVEHALLMSLAAVPVYLLARRVGLSQRFALACAAYALALPDLSFAGYTLAGALGYPLVLTALYAGVVALEAPSRRGQLAFLVVAFLATLAKVQFVVLFPAFAAAAALLDRRRVLRTQRLPLALLGAALVGAFALGPSRVLGYYSAVFHLHVGADLLRWAGLDLFLLALAGGVVLVPGALVGLVRARGRAETAFALAVGAFAFGLLLEAGLYASNGAHRFQERYLFSLLPLVPIAFGLYLKRERPARYFVVALAVILFVLAVRVPLSGYAAGIGDTDSPFLWATVQLDQLVGIGTGSLLISLCVAVAAVGTIVVAWRGGERIAIGCALGFVAAASLAAGVYDAQGSRDVRRLYLPANPSWVDASGLSNVTAIETPLARSVGLLEQLFWNRSITRELVLGSAFPTDAFAASAVHVAPDGTLRTKAGVVRTPLLFQGYAADARFDGAALVARGTTFQLWRPHGTPRLRLLELGRYWDGWLADSGSITVWPAAGGETRGVVSFTLSLPRDAAPVTIRFGGVAHRLAGGERLPLRYRVDHAGPWRVAFTAAGPVYPTDDLRAVSVRSTAPVLEPAPH